MNKTLIALCFLISKMTYASQSSAYNFTAEELKYFEYYHMSSHSNINGHFKADNIEIQLDVSNLASNKIISSLRNNDKKNFIEYNQLNELRHNNSNNAQKQKFYSGSDSLYCMINEEIKPLKFVHAGQQNQDQYKQYLEVVTKDWHASGSLYRHAILVHKNEDVMFKRLVIHYKTMRLLNTLVSERDEPTIFPNYNKIHYLKFYIQYDGR